MTVLVLTQPLDTTADLVITELATRGARVFRCDTGQFPAELTVTARLDRSWTGTLTTPHRALDLTDVTAVYYRRPSPFTLPDRMSPTEASWADKEARYGLGGVLTSLRRCRWVNHPHNNARAAYKPYQLATAAAVGLRVPRTLVTNDPAAAARFAGDVGPVVYKPFTLPDRPGWALFTTPVVPRAGDEGITATAHLFQERVPKAFEVRLTVIGREMFAARIDAASPAARVDWRSDYDALTYTRVDLPGPVRRDVTMLMRRLGLRFGALDFIVTPNGEWVFLEVNPNGQWGWIAHRTGYPIAAAIAAYLHPDEGTNP